MKLLAVLALTLALSGCTRTRLVEVTLPAPPPSIVTQTDTLVMVRPVEVPRIETLVLRDTVFRTLPAQVLTYEQPRSGPAFPLAALRLNADRLTLFGLRQDVTFRAPVLGETLVLETVTPDSLASAVTGTPLPRTVTAECPDCPEALIPRSLGGLIQVFMLIGFGAVVGVVAFLLVRGSR